MLILEKTPLPNGAHRNLSGNGLVVPEGWFVVPEELEEKALTLLPFIVLDFTEDDELTDVSQGVIPPAPEPEPEPVSDINEALATVALASMGLQMNDIKQANAEVALLQYAGVEPADEAEKEWRAGEYVTKGTIRTVDEVRYFCIHPHLTGDHWHPSKTLSSVWNVVADESGTVSDPIPFVLGMAVEKDKHYSYKGKVYRWKDADHPSCSWPPDTAIWQWEVVS